MPDGVVTAFTAVVTYTKDMIVLVTANPVLSLGIAAWVAGLTIGLYKRLV